ncbi:family 1 glycosylhydrolase [Agromyces atrinae]|uniref:Beta-glucosidase/6-phospho-beta-glucosidase/beta-galactosidase n=1 Tax=Agromyces atrinae TaxID=592376 RepID=A0A4V1R1Z6_9MICO|nr:family 1 glycosylhydrolase [Agromyces atrinae]NYD66988.1 beta-glucosidase/6-phospho-beta-glucosidase/beta-galactosidase [Agromyces atrinae]RXZ85278.1 glycosyl hydrolase family protein [Agromyces atrinae]RXZ85386.1 glycosyl hydrolase family protein [Agromyces atrinae]
MVKWFDDGKLRFAVGVEDTFIPQTRPGERALDEYELMQHYRFWSDDLGYCAEAGADMVRWGIPWYRINPEPGTWDWSWLDRVIDRFEELDLSLVADLVHYGTPLWLEGEFLNPDYAQRVAEYSAAVAERYAGRIHSYTPLNEPLLNIMYCGEFGQWPPYLTGDRGFVDILRAISRGIVETQSAIASVDPRADFVHVEASFRFAGDVAAHPETVEHLRHRAYLVQDLVMGRVDQAHPLVPFLTRNGFSERDLEWSRDNIADPDVVGVNYYPQHSTELFVAGTDPSGGPNDLRPRLDAGTEGLADVVTSFAERYGKPVFLTETSYTGTVDERISWMDESVAAITDLRASGVPVIGYTWWCITDMVEWSYRPATGPALDHRLRMGLWSLEEDADGTLQRIKTPVADRFRAHATAAQTPVAAES